MVQGDVDEMFKDVRVRHVLYITRGIVTRILLTRVNQSFWPRVLTPTNLAFVGAFGSPCPRQGDGQV